jgi:hypothetical protein
LRGVSEDFLLGVPIRPILPTKKCYLC